MTPAIELSHLTKRYGNMLAVDHLSLTVAPGEIVGLLGPNGAGKTTTVKMLTGLLIPTEGTACIMGHDLQREPLRAKRLMGYIPDRPYLYEKLTGREFLQFMGGIYRVSAFAKASADDSDRRTEELLELFELTKWQDELIESYSHGMRQKLVMTGALLHQPQVLIIDEPMVGLDPKGAKIVKEIFKNLALKGVGILLCTHSMELVEMLCHRIAILQQSRLVALGTLADLKHQAQQDGADLEDIFLKLTGSAELTDVLKALA